MANVLDIRRRIRSVKNTRQITKAMKMVSAARLRRAQERALAARPFARMLTNVLRSLVSRAEIADPATGLPKHPLLAARPEKHILLVLVTGDRGLAGAFNSNVLKAAARFLEANQGKTIDIEAVGRKGRDYLRRRYPAVERDEAGNPATTARAGDIQITGEYLNLLAKVEYEPVSEIANRIIDRYADEEIDAVYVLYNEFKSVIAQRLVVERVLPIQEIGERKVTQAEELTEEERSRVGEAAKAAGVSLEAPEPTELEKEAEKFGTAQIDYIYEQPAEELFSGMLPQYVTIQIFQAMLESVAAEHAARMTAMDSATNNATELIDSYTLSMNRARQASITKEIIEIVSGAAAL